MSFEKLNLDIYMDFTKVCDFEVFILNPKKNERPFVISFFHLKCYKPSKLGLPKLWTCFPIPIKEKKFITIIFLDYKIQLAL
jgi:hypothetical protein